MNMKMNHPHQYHHLKPKYQQRLLNHHRHQDNCQNQYHFLQHNLLLENMSQSYLRHQFHRLVHHHLNHLMNQKMFHYLFRLYRLQLR